MRGIWQTKTHAFEVWSTGLARWDPAFLEGNEVRALTPLYVKEHLAKKWVVCRAPDGRYFRYQIPSSFDVGAVPVVVLVMMKGMS